MKEIPDRQTVLQELSYTLIRDHYLTGFQVPVYIGLKCKLYFTIIKVHDR